GASLVKADLREAILGPLPLSADRINRGDLHHAKLRYVQAQGADLTSVILDDADVRGCDFSGAVLKGASLRGADLTTAYGIQLGA
nr:pentapeptide repeat-containing protein [Phenylobacterium sp.]